MSKTNDEIIFQLDHLKDFATDAQKEALDVAIKMLKREPCWISVSERLPEERGLYIVTEKEFRIDDREHKGKYNTRVEQAEYYNGKWQRANFFEVIAWQSLPEPYRIQESEGEIC